jgi:putative glycosyltransferase (TIGR04372 family)
LDNFRNFDFEDFYLAIRWIHDHGGACIRMGDSSMRPVNKVDGLIDYATSPLKRDWLDIYLAGSCRFFLGSASGLYNIASVFGRPVATVNMAPFSMALPLGKGDIGIPKLYRNRKSGRLLRFDEIISLGAANYRFADEFIAADIQLESNSPEDILDLVIEQYNRTEGIYLASEEDLVLQKLFVALFKDGDYCYMSSAKVGSAFLRKYKDLLK